MSGIIDDETTAKLIKHIRKTEQESPHFQATILNFVWSLHKSDGNLDEIDLSDEEIEEIFDSMPTNPELELEYMD